LTDFAVLLKLYADNLKWTLKGAIWSTQSHTKCCVTTGIYHSIAQICYHQGGKAGGKMSNCDS